MWADGLLGAETQWCANEMGLRSDMPEINENLLYLLLLYLFLPMFMA